MKRMQRISSADRAAAIAALARKMEEHGKPAEELEAVAQEMVKRSKQASANISGRVLAELHTRGGAEWQNFLKGVENTMRMKMDNSRFMRSFRQQVAEAHPANAGARP